MTEADKAAEQITKNIADLNSKIENGATKEEMQTALDAIKESQKNLISKEEYKKLEDSVKGLNEVITELKENGSTMNNSVKNTLLKEVTEKKEEIKNLVAGRGKEVAIKAPVYRSSIVDSNSQYVLGGVTQLGVKKRSLYDVFRKVTLPDGNNAGKITYTDWDEATIVRAAAATAEGAVFNESTAGFRSYSIDLKKITDTLPVSEEFGEDEVSAAAELEMFLSVNMETKIDNDLVNADGVGLNIKGLLASVPSYTATQEGIPSANIYDLTKKVKTDITFDRGSKYQPDFVVMNDNLADMLHLEKDKNDNYIFPDKMNVGSIEIIIDNNMGNDTMVVGDSRYGTIYEKEGFTIERVYVNDQAIKDMATLKARKRILFLIKNGDATGFRKVEGVAAALATLSQEGV